MIYTSYFGNVKRLIGQHPNLKFVSIAGKTPDWFLNDKIIEGMQFKKLMPKYSWWSIWHEKFKDNLESEESKSWYEEKYCSTVLSCLSQEQVRNELLEMSNKFNVCLLCYETPEKFCHRHIVQKWLNEGGVECSEISN